MSPPSTSHAAHLPESSTLDHPSNSPSPARKRQRIYQSLSSAFSRYTTPRANSPELFPASFPKAVDGISWTEEEMVDMDTEPLEEIGARDDSSQSSIREPVAMDKVALASRKPS